MISKRNLSILVFLFILVNNFIKEVSSNALWPYSTDSNEEWKGAWFPHSPNMADTNPIDDSKSKESLYDSHHGILMGVKNKHCDDANTNLEIDWDFNVVNYTCFEKNRFGGKSDVMPILSNDHIPVGYSATHSCMNKKIIYDKLIPTYGTHRPLWPKYGEYEFVPKQRWIHNLEHGAIVMLYHPCADRNEVKLLKDLVKSCLYRHIITPYNLLSSERPLALVSWGFRLEMSKVAPEVVVEFITRHALNGPEKLSKDGQYNLRLISHAKIVSDINDISLCKNFNHAFIE